MARIKPQALLQQSKKKKGPARMSLTTIIMGASITILTIFLVYSTYRHWSQRSATQMDVRASAVEDNTFPKPRKSDLPGYAVLNTAKGAVTVELFKDSSPEVVDEFINLSQKEEFNGMLFRRVIKHYVIQAGNTDKLSSVEDWAHRGKHYGQLSTSLKHEAFMLGTSKAKNERGGFELFITTAPIPDLSEKLIVFGRVVKGEDVIQEIEEVDTDEHYQPKSSIGIISVTLQHKL